MPMLNLILDFLGLQFHDFPSRLTSIFFDSKLPRLLDFFAQNVVIVLVLIDQLFLEHILFPNIHGNILFDRCQFRLFLGYFRLQIVKFQERFFVHGMQVGQPFGTFLILFQHVVLFSRQGRLGIKTIPQL